MIEIPLGYNLNRILSQSVKPHTLRLGYEL